MHGISNDHVAAQKAVGPDARVTRRMIHERTRALAIQAGRDALRVTHADYARARSELTGESEFVRQDAVLNSFARTQRARMRS